jgi:hypothetical protein
VDMVERICLAWHQSAAIFDMAVVVAEVDMTYLVRLVDIVDIVGHQGWLYNQVCILDHQGWLYNQVCILDHQGWLYNQVCILDHQGWLYNQVCILDHQGWWYNQVCILDHQGWSCSHQLVEEVLRNQKNLLDKEEMVAYYSRKNHPGILAVVEEVYCSLKIRLDMLGVYLFLVVLVEYLFLVV